MVQRDMPFSYLRMHGIFHEDMMVYRENAGHPVFNWQYVDMVYDHWLSVGIRPFVELSFMPYDLASGNETMFWWKGNITPPKDWAGWELLVRRFVEVFESADDGRFSSAHAYWDDADVSFT